MFCRLRVTRQWPEASRKKDASFPGYMHNKRVSFHAEMKHEVLFFARRRFKQISFLDKKRKERASQVPNSVVGLVIGDSLTQSKVR